METSLPRLSAAWDAGCTGRHEIGVGWDEMGRGGGAPGWGGIGRSGLCVVGVWLCVCACVRVCPRARVGMRARGCGGGGTGIESERGMGGDLAIAEILPNAPLLIGHGFVVRLVDSCRPEGGRRDVVGE